MKVDPKPNIYDFKNPIGYLESMFAHERSQNKTLSLNKWASSLGLKSPDALAEVMKGKKNLSHSMISLFSEKFNLDNSEQIFFEALVKYVQAKTITEKHIMELVLAELTQLSGKKAIVDDMNIFSHWVHMAILSLSNIKGIHCSKATIRNFLHEDVSQGIIEQAVDNLIAAGLMEYDESGNLIQKHLHVSSKNDSSKYTAHTYFEQVSELAKAGSKVPADQREFQCFTMAIKESEIPTFKAAFRKFRAKLGVLSQDHEPDRVYQCNLQLFPLTQEFNSEFKKSDSFVETTAKL